VGCDNDRPLRDICWELCVRGEGVCIGGGGGPVV
jgi:hypothetical protein